jgi:hypothetical protein
VPTNAFEAGRLLASCDAAVFRGLRRPGNVEIRRTWMRRFVKEMHWLSAVELLSGCRADTDPAAHAALMAAIADEAVPRVGHRPWGRQERHWWSMLLGDSLGPLCPSPAARGLVRSAALTLRDGEGDVFFVAHAAIAAAEAAPHGLTVPQCFGYLRDNLHYDLGPREREAIGRFRRLADTLGLLDDRGENAFRPRSAAAS